MSDSFDSKDRQTITFNNKVCPNCKKGELLENSSMNGKYKWLQCNNCEDIFKLKEKRSEISMKGKILVVDPRGVEWCYWNVMCSKCGNLFYRENPKKCISPCHKLKWKIIKPLWTTDGYIPSKNKYIQYLKIKETSRGAR